MPNATNKTFATFIDSIGGVALSVVVPLLFAFALLFFLYGVLKFISNAGSEEKRKEAKLYIVWGLIGLAVMISIWGLVQIVAGTFGQSIGIPQINQNYFK